MVSKVLTTSHDSPRMRMLQKLHKSEDAGVHRMFNALQPGTYIPPHRHLDPAKDETILVMSGSVLFIRFSDTGDIEDQILLQPGTETFGIDVAPHVYHTFIALKPDTLIFEVKDGPYSKDTDKDIPDWAPHEGTDEAEPYLLEMVKKLAAAAQAAADTMKQEPSSEE